MKYIIYGISVGDYKYIGSTRDFKQRKISHKHNCINTNDTNKKYNMKVYQMIREAGGWDKCEMVPIEEYICITKTQAHIREEYWRRLYDANMNSQRAYCTKDEATEQAKENSLIQNTCECGGKYRNSRKLRHERTKKHQDYLANNNISI